MTSLRKSRLPLAEKGAPAKVYAHLSSRMEVWKSRGESADENAPATLRIEREMVEKERMDWALELPLQPTIQVEAENYTDIAQIPRWPGRGSTIVIPSNLQGSHLAHQRTAARGKNLFAEDPRSYWGLMIWQKWFSREKGTKQGAKKGGKKGREKGTVNNPNIWSAMVADEEKEKLKNEPKTSTKQNITRPRIERGSSA
ncbi:hypothetical protein C8R43DRAFT_955069 [Mycena crocata]|nr:hypothetical protein C8R43DRAFT_955069 [Mycena crocata]